MNWVVLAGLMLTFAGVVIAFLQLRKKIAEVHVLVNSQLGQVIARVAQLTETLHDAGVDVPHEES